MTKKQMMFLALFVLGSFGGYDLYQMKFSEEPPKSDLKTDKKKNTVKIMSEENSKEESSSREDPQIYSEDVSKEDSEDVEEFELLEIPEPQKEGNMESFIGTEELKFTGVETVKPEDVAQKGDSQKEVPNSGNEEEFELLEITPTKDVGQTDNVEVVLPAKEILETKSPVQIEELAPPAKEEIKLSKRDETRLEFYEKKVMDLRAASEGLKEKLMEQDVERNKLSSKIRLAQEKERILLSEIESLKGRVAELKEEKNREVQAIQKSTEGYAEQLERNNKEIAFLNSKEVELKSIIKEKEDMIVSLNENIDKKYKDVTDMQTKVKNTVIGGEDSKETADILNIKLEKANGQISALKMEILDLESELRDVKFSRNEINEKIKEFSLRNNEIEKTLLDKEKILASKDSEIRYLKRKVEKVLKEKELKRRELVKIIVKNRKDLEELKKKNHRKTREARGLLKKVEELESVLDTSKKKREDMRKELKLREKQQEDLMNLIKEKEDSGKRLLKELGDSQKRNTALEKEVENLKKTKLSIQFEQELKLNELKSKMKKMEEEFKEKKIEREYEVVSVVGIDSINKATQDYEAEIEKISRSKNDKLLEQLAKNPRMSSGILKRLAGSKSFYVRNEVAKNPNITTEIGFLLSKDEVEVVRMSLIDNKSTSKEVLTILLKDPSKRVRDYAEYKMGGKK